MIKSIQLSLFEETGIRALCSFCDHPATGSQVVFMACSPEWCECRNTQPAPHRIPQCERHLHQVKYLDQLKRKHECQAVLA